MGTFRSVATSTSIITGIVLSMILLVRALELIVTGSPDTFLEPVITLVLGAFITAVTAERVAHSLQSGGSPIFDGLVKNGHEKETDGNGDSGTGDGTATL